MNKKQIAVYEKRGYDNASFATGYSKEKADLCVRKIYETYRKNSKKTGITDTEKVFPLLSQ